MYEKYFKVRIYSIEFIQFWLAKMSERAALQGVGIIEASVAILERNSRPNLDELLSIFKSIMKGSESEVDDVVDDDYTSSRKDAVHQIGKKLIFLWIKNNGVG